MNNLPGSTIERLMIEPAADAGRAYAAWSWYYFTEARLVSRGVVHH